MRLRQVIAAQCKDESVLAGGWNWASLQEAVNTGLKMLLNGSLEGQAELLQIWNIETNKNRTFKSETVHSCIQGLKCLTFSQVSPCNYSIISISTSFILLTSSSGKCWICIKWLRPLIGALFKTNDQFNRWPWTCNCCHCFVHCEKSL